MLRRSASGIDVGSLTGFDGGGGGLRRSTSYDAGTLGSVPSLLPRQRSETTPDLRALLKDSGLYSIPEFAAAAAVTQQPTCCKPTCCKKSMVLICFLSVIDGMDIQLLPASFKALESDLGLRPTHLALLAVCQGYAMCISGPFWGSVADSGFPRKWLLAAGSFMWGTLTLLLALVDSFHVMMLLRTLNGVALGLLTPVIQSFIAELSSKSEIGFNFGCIDFCHMAIGQALSLVTISFIAERTVFGMAGWRFAFIIVALMSIAMSVPIVLCLEEEPRQWRPEGVGLRSEFKKFLRYLKMPTFLVLVGQGIFGTIPSSAMAFTTMYFQYIGVGSLSGLVAAFKIIGTGIGSVLGGLIGDRLAIISPMHGRALTAQMSVALSIPIAASVFLLVPPREDLWPVHAGMLFLLGLVHWCSSSCNRPVLVELVAPDCIGSVVAWQNCIEHMSGFILGPVGVALLSELLFDYVPARLSVASMTTWEREVNAAALGQSLALCTALPWTLCFFLYGLMHVTYPKDLAQAEALEPPSGSGSVEASALRRAGLGGLGAPGRSKGRGRG